MEEVTEFFRCTACHTVKEAKQLVNCPGCGCGSRKFIPTILSPFEIFIYCLKHPLVLFNTLYALAFKGHTWTKPPERQCPK